MSDHQPECYLSSPPGMCPMCEALRACEQRVRQGFDDFFARHADKYQEIGFDAGLYAAREAVAALENIGGYPPSVFDHIKEDVIDAIDALKEKP